MLTFDIKSDDPATFGTQAHTVPYSYKHWDFFGSVSSTTSWTTFSKEVTITPDLATSGAIAFNLGKEATAFYFDNISLTKYNEEGSGGGVSEAGYALEINNPSIVNAWEAQTVYDLVAENNEGLIE